MLDSESVLWNRRPISVLIRARVHVWSGHPYATGPLANSRSRTANRAWLSFGRVLPGGEHPGSLQSDALPKRPPLGRQPPCGYLMVRTYRDGGHL
ncbi:hypothetical protein ACIQ9Q_38620 [Streptomyces sp. NPDC094438]|uniref:hypothetical protein n=1 Tax=Streptomyces sp. NPDC094438 TaxID=3366061 RepID=UPI0038073633